MLNTVAILQSFVNSFRSPQYQQRDIFYLSQKSHVCLIAQNKRAGRREDIFFFLNLIVDTIYLSMNLSYPRYILRTITLYIHTYNIITKARRTKCIDLGLAKKLIPAVGSKLRTL